jgi:hypothetical protein
MKKIFSNIKITMSIFLIQLLSFSTYAQAPFKQTNVIIKTYKLLPGDKISLFNTFGNMIVKTWDKNEVKATIEIITQAGSDERAKQLMNCVNITSSKINKKILLKTNVSKWQHDDDSVSTHDSTSRNTITINYEVYLPGTNVTEAENRFGTMTISDCKAPIEVRSSYGSLIINNVNKAINVFADFDDVKVNNLQINGYLKLNYCTVQLNNLSQTLHLFTNNCKPFSIDLNSNIQKLIIEDSYTDLVFKINQTLSASFNVACDTYPVEKGSVQIKEQNTSSEHSFKGIIGDGKMKVIVHSSFGHIRFNATK